MVTQPNRPHRQVIRMHSIDYSKISITAKLVAHFRKYSDIAFADDVTSFVSSERDCRKTGHLSGPTSKKKCRMRAS